MNEKAERYRKLIEELIPLAEAGEIKRICELLKERIPYFQWVGIYYVDPRHPRQLLLGDFAGAGTEHTTIPFGRGICGQVAESEKTFVVQDVTKQTNYLSCNPDVRSEIVVPIFDATTFIAQLDIDSNSLAPFTDEDTKYLDKICQLLAPPLISRYR